MQPTVLIVEDSPSTAHLAKMALAEVSCQIEVVGDAARALELVRGELFPWVMVVDAHLPRTSLTFFAQLHEAVPGASMVLLLDRGVHTPQMPLVSAQLYKPLQPRRLRTVVVHLIDAHQEPDQASERDL